MRALPLLLAANPALSLVCSRVNATTNKIYMGHVNGSITVLNGATSATTNPDRATPTGRGVAR